MMEDEMTALKSLTFATLPKSMINPTLDRRNKMIARLDEQKRLLNDSTYMRVVQKWQKNESGEKTLVEKKQRVLQWWIPQSNGSFLFFVRAGWKAIDFEKGKAAIAVQSLDKLPSVIDALISAIRNGELDDQMAQASAHATPKKPKGK
jgi:hypothetical protein